MEWIRFAVRGLIRTESSLIFANALEQIAEHPRTQHISLAKMYPRNKLSCNVFPRYCTEVSVLETLISCRLHSVRLFRYTLYILTVSWLSTVVTALIFTLITTCELRMAQETISQCVIVINNHPSDTFKLARE